MVTNPVLLPDYDGSGLSAWASGFPSHSYHDSDATPVGQPTSFHILLFIPLPFHSMASPSIPNEEGFFCLGLSPPQGTYAPCMHFDNPEVLTVLPPLLKYSLN